MGWMILTVALGSYAYYQDMNITYMKHVVEKIGDPMGKFVDRSDPHEAGSLVHAAKDPEVRQDFLAPIKKLGKTAKDKYNDTYNKADLQKAAEAFTSKGQEGAAVKTLAKGENPMTTTRGPNDPFATQESAAALAWPGQPPFGDSLPPQQSQRKKQYAACC